MGKFFPFTIRIMTKFREERIVLHLFLDDVEKLYRRKIWKDSITRGRKRVSLRFFFNSDRIQESYWGWSIILKVIIDQNQLPHNLYDPIEKIKKIFSKYRDYWEWEFILEDHRSKNIVLEL